MLEYDVFKNLRAGDKLVVKDREDLLRITDWKSFLDFAGKEVTVKCLDSGDVKLEEDTNNFYWSRLLFKNLVNGKRPEDFEPVFAEQQKFTIGFDYNDFRAGSLCYYKLVKITDNLDIIERYNSPKFAKVIVGKWIVVNTMNDRAYSKYNPHLLLEQNRCDNYRIDNKNSLIVDSKTLFNDGVEWGNLEIDFENATFTNIPYDGEVCCQCGRPVNAYNKIGKYCSSCLTKDGGYTYRFGYHDYGGGYKVYEDVNTEVEPVFGCEIERDYVAPERYDDYDEDEEYYEDQNFGDDLDSATMDIIKIMQGDQLENGTLRRENVFMTDGSLNCDGLEWITFPHTFEWYVENKDKFNKTIRRIADYGFTNTDQAGNHIHINRDYFTINGRDYSDFCASKIAILFTKYWEEFRAIADRHDTSYTEKPNLEEDDTPFEIFDKMNRNKGEHSVAVNLQHSKTVEIRLWSGINDADDLLFYLDNMQALAKYAKKTNLEKVQCAKITDFMKYYKLDSSLNIAYHRIKSWGRTYGSSKLQNIRARALKDIERLIAKKGEQK